MNDSWPLSQGSRARLAEGHPFAIVPDSHTSKRRTSFIALLSDFDLATTSRCFAKSSHFSFKLYHFTFIFWDLEASIFSSELAIAASSLGSSQTFTWTPPCFSSGCSQGTEYHKHQKAQDSQPHCLSATKREWFETVWHHLAFLTLPMVTIVITVWVAAKAQSATNTSTHKIVSLIVYLLQKKKI